MTYREERAICEKCGREATVARGLHEAEAGSVTTFTTTCPECGHVTVTHVQGDATRG